MGTSDSGQAVQSGDLLAEAVDIMRCLVDLEPCRYDHHDNCQAHSLGVRPCEHEQAKAFLAKYDSAANMLAEQGTPEDRRSLARGFASAMSENAKRMLADIFAADYVRLASLGVPRT
jgi:hypothetical protein